MFRSAMFLLILFWAGCSPTFDETCTSAEDCFSNEICAAGSCTVKGGPGGTNNGTTNNGVDPDVAAIEVIPETLEVVKGVTGTLAAKVTDSEGNVITKTITWKSADDSIATVDENGVVTGAKVGQTVVSANIGPVKGEATIKVIGVEVDTITITPSNATIKTGQDSTFTVEVKGTDGQVMANPTIIWGTTDAQIITVDDNGVVHGVKPGSAQLIAQVDEVQGFAEIEVNDVSIETITIAPDVLDIVIGGNASLTAMAKDVDGNDLSGRIFTWSSSNEAVATVDMMGLVTGVAPGMATITAEAEGVMGSAIANVGVVQVDHVEIGPMKTISRAQNETLQLNVKAFDSNNMEILGRTANWSSSDVAIATIDSNGTLTFLDTGMVTITVDVDGKTDTAAITITPSPISTITIVSLETEVADGAMLPLGIEVRDSMNNLLLGRTITWSSDNAAVATVDSSGQVTGVMLGTTIIRASAEGVEGSFSIDVVVGPVDTVGVTPPSATISIASPTVQLTAILLDAQNNPVVDVVTWSSSDVAIATVDNTGLVTRVAMGSVTISAVSDGIMGFSTITVAD